MNPFDMLRCEINAFMNYVVKHSKGGYSFVNVFLFFYQHQTPGIYLYSILTLNMVSI